MDQRPLRLGDLVDDYCPRERRLTNHAIVAIVGEQIRQTRCTTCDAEHVFKGGKAPVRKKKDTTAVLYEQVLANVTAGTVAGPPEPSPPVHASPEPVAETPVAAAAEDDPITEPPAAEEQPWSLHRTLIRATLPRTEQTQTPRPIPEFTMHQRNVRGSHMFRSGGHQNGHQNGHQQDRFGNGGGFRNDGPPGSPNGQRPGGRRRRRHKKPRPV